MRICMVPAGYAARIDKINADCTRRPWYFNIRWGAIESVPQLGFIFRGVGFGGFIHNCTDKNDNKKKKMYGVQ